MSLNSYLNNFSSKERNEQSYLGYETEPNNSTIQFENMLNNLTEWQNNPIEATRLCFKYIYEISRSQQKRIELIDKQKASKNELTSGLNTKGDLADIMHTFNEVAQNIEQRPTKDEIIMSLEGKLSKEDLNKSIDELKKNFITKKELDDIKNNNIKKEHIANLLNDKVNKSDFENIVKDLKNFSSIEGKVKTIDNDLDRLIEHMKKQFNTIDSTINNLIKNKSEYKDIQEINNKINELKNIMDGNSNLNDEIQKIKNDINNISSKYNSINIENKNSMNRIEAKLKNDENNLIQNIDNKMSIIFEQIKSNNIREGENFQNNMYLINQNIERINEKIIKIETQKYITISDFENISINLKSDMKDFQNYIKDYLKNFDEELINQINQKISINDAKEIFAQKEEIINVQRICNSKASTVEMENLKLNLEKMTKKIQKFGNLDNFDKILQNFSENLQEIKNDLLLKSNIDEVMSYLKNKANIDDVNKALLAIQNDLDNKSSLDDFNHAMKNQNNINTYLAKENSIAKWIWESGQVNKGYMVPWEIQVINTMPENFLWEKNDVFITIKNKGIYLISLAFFVREKPTIQVLINGKSVLSQVNSNAFIIRQDNSNNNLDEYENNDNCSSTGVTMNEFLYLQNMSKIVISYSGSQNVKGMMSIKQICPL